MNLDTPLSETQRVGKSKSAFRTISEVADELDVPQHVLRFWESKFSHIKPLKRGGGRRYYRPTDVDLLRRIRDLLYQDGYTIKGVQKLLKEGKAAEPRAPRTASEARAEPASDVNDQSATDDDPEAARRQELEAILAELLEIRALLP